MLYFQVGAINKLLIIFSNLQIALMNRSQNSSYEGFRRKNSLNSHEIINSNTSTDTMYPKIKKQDLKLVENLSMELQNISKRSLTSRSYGQNSKHHTQSCHFISMYNQEAIQKKPFNKPKLEITSLKKITFEADQEQLSLSEIKKQKTGNNVGFNQFDIIQETRSFCEEEINEDISPVTLKHSYHEATAKTKVLTKPTSKVVSTPRTVYKKPALKNEIFNPKDKIKHDLSQLDKMQKELDTKKISREAGTKNLSNSTGLKRKEIVNSIKDTIKNRPLTPNEAKVQNLRTAALKSSKNVIPQPKIIESKPPVLALQKNEEKVQSQQMVATRMLSQKEKSHLVGRLLELRSIIEKNQICSDSNEQIVFHLNSIEKLLTY